MVEAEASERWTAPLGGRFAKLITRSRSCRPARDLGIRRRFPGTDSDNPINRYLINSPMLPKMKNNADGSLTLYVQKDSPGKDKESNWLPAPNGPVYMVMRLYWPKKEPPSVLPPGDGTRKPPAIVQVK